MKTQDVKTSKGVVKTTRVTTTSILTQAMPNTQLSANLKSDNQSKKITKSTFLIR